MKQALIECCLLLLLLLLLQLLHAVPNSSEQNPYWEAGSSQLLKDLPAFYAIRRFDTVVAETPRLAVLNQMSSVRVIPSYFSVRFNIPFTPGFSKWSLSFRVPHMNPVCISVIDRCVSLSEQNIRCRCKNFKQVLWKILWDGVTCSSSPSSRHYIKAECLLPVTCPSCHPGDTSPYHLIMFLLDQIS